MNFKIPAFVPIAILSLYVHLTPGRLQRIVNTNNSGLLQIAAEDLSLREDATINNVSKVIN